jgi:transcriptional regulator with XRE-family HTH domain
MGRGTRPRPKRLGEKLTRIREGLGLSQNGMVRSLGFEDSVTRDYISAYERGVREPPLPVLLRYARAAGVWVDVLIDDQLDLPARLPATRTHRGVPHKRSGN